MPVSAGTSNDVIVLTYNEFGSTRSAVQVIPLTGANNQQTQTINFTPPASPVIFVVSPITLVATGGGSGNPVVFSIDGSSTGTGSISGNMLTVTGVGNLVIDANQAGSTSYVAATQVQRTLVVNAAPQIISVPAPPSPVDYRVSPITLAATGGASGNPVVFSIVSGPGSVSGANGTTLTITGVGTVVVAANQAGSSNYAAATQVTRSIVIDQLAALISPTPGNTLTGSSATFNWSAGTGVTKYEFRLGTTAPGSSNLYNSTGTTTTALTSGLVSNIPATGAILYARIYSWINGA